MNDNIASQNSIQTMMTTEIGQKQQSHLAFPNKQHMKCSRGKKPTLLFSHSLLITKEIRMPTKHTNHD